MLDQIFQDYWDKVISGEDKIKEVYATYSNTPSNWICCEDITVKDLVNRICDEFEDAGYDLNDVPIGTIRDRFINFEISVEIPTQYTGLNDVKLYIEKQLDIFNSNEGLQSHPDGPQLESNLRETHKMIIAKIQEFYD